MRLKHSRKYLGGALIAVFLVTASPAFAQTVPSSTSENWAGYVTTGSSYSAVHASWTVPHVSVAQTGADATWIGIGGVTSNDLIQTGTEAIIQNGAVTYDAWIETLPSGEQDVPLTINAGDSISASLNQTSTNVWQVSLTDNTTDQNYTTSVNYDSSLSSAEWIEEMPAAEMNGRRFNTLNLIPLDNFGTIEFNTAGVTANNSAKTIAGSNAQPLNMITNTGVALATPSSLGPDGSSFSVVRSNANTILSNTQPAVGQSYYPRARSEGRTGVGVQGFTQGRGHQRFGFESFIIRYR